MALVDRRVYLDEGTGYMKKLLVTGGTVFASRYTAEYYVAHGYEVYVLNRNTRKQAEGVRLIEADRHNLENQLKNIHFDVVLDVTAYSGRDISDLLNGLGSFDEYIMISSSAVYPETEMQPFKEGGNLSENKFWRKYGTDKISAERELLKRNPGAYILRPPYLYGPMNNVYREAFVFECALKNRKFYLPKDGNMQLQFFYIADMCRFIDVLLERKPKNHIFNVGNKETVTIRDWVTQCYSIVGKKPEFVPAYNEPEQRNYFCFYDYEYSLDVTRQYELMAQTMPLDKGLKEAFEWYRANKDEVIVKPYIEYIDNRWK